MISSLPSAPGNISPPIVRETQVLIVGAGPTGLVLALWLTRQGTSVRIIDKAAEPGTTSRAIVVQARTLEFYRQIGIADEVVERGLKLAAANLWVRGRKAGRAAFGEMGKGLSPFPYALMFPQDEHERLLIERLSVGGIEVERRIELVSFEDVGDRVMARLKRPDGTEEVCEAAYLAGCDGAHSKVREVLKTSFPGGTYAHVFYVADVQATGPAMDGELHVALDEADLLVIFPLKGVGRARLIGTVRQDTEKRHEHLGWDAVSKRLIERMRIEVERVNWFSTYHVHHRVAAHFRGGRTFLLGDAAHIHSPVGGQGMNTGIGDTVNLAWKLAAVLHSRADLALLATYEPERIAFARRLVATTDQAFKIITSDGPVARFVRVHIVPRLLPALFRSNSVRRFMFRTISQTAVNYRKSSLSEGIAGRVRGGDRLPWIEFDGTADRPTDNFIPLTSLDWQVHVYGEPRPGIPELCKRRGLPSHVFPWLPMMPRAGLRRNAVYLVRPDGYVALADPDASASRLEAYLDARGLGARQGNERGL
jgi:2-polyprenyl-6-methoxyphenol hydroxylase-like FAD-dependent oxidoreductase